MKTIKLLVELTYDEDLMHGEDPESIRWFRDEILMCENREDLLLHSNEIGDTVGSIRVLQLPEEVERSEEFTAGKMRMLADVQDQLEENTRVYIRTRDYWEGRTRKLEDELDEVYRALDDVPFVRPTETLTLVEAEDVLKRLARWCRNNIGLLEKGSKFRKWVRG